MAGSRVEPFEVIRTEDHRVSCDGGSGPLGHPLIYLEIGAGGEAVCPYCSRQFVLKKKHQA